MGDDDKRTPEETERIRDAALKRALSTPPKPHKAPKDTAKGRGTAKPSSRKSQD